MPFSITSKNIMFQPIGAYLECMQKENQDSLKVRVMALALVYFAAKDAIRHTLGTLLRIPGVILSVPLVLLIIISPWESGIYKIAVKGFDVLPNIVDVGRNAAKAIFLFHQIILAPLIGAFSPRINQKMFARAGFTVEVSIKKPKATSQKIAGFIGFDQIAGFEELKARAREVIDLMSDTIDREEELRSLGVNMSNGVLLYGPPGCGKTFFCERFREEIEKSLGKRVAMHQITPGGTGSKWIHETSGNIREIFKKAKQDAKRNDSFSIVFIDEIDGMFPRAAGFDSASSLSREEDKKTILMELNNVGSERVLVLATTNYRERLDEALTRTGRFDFEIEIPRPDKIAVLDFLNKSLIGVLESSINFKEIAKFFEGRNMTDVKAFCDRVKAKAYFHARRAVPKTDKIVTLTIKPEFINLALVELGILDCPEAK